MGIALRKCYAESGTDEGYVATPGMFGLVPCLCHVRYCLRYVCTGSLSTPYYPPTHPLLSATDLRPTVFSYQYSDPAYYPTSKTPSDQDYHNLLLAL
eukprot:3832955-Rhodomonas_salina.1